MNVEEMDLPEWLLDFVVTILSVVLAFIFRAIKRAIFPYRDMLDLPGEPGRTHPISLVFASAMLGAIAGIGRAEILARRIDPVWHVICIGILALAMVVLIAGTYDKEGWPAISRTVLVFGVGILFFLISLVCSSRLFHIL